MTKMESYVQEVMNWALRAERLFDGNSKHSGFPVVYLRGQQILSVDFSGAHPASSVPLVDLGSSTLMPGMIDTHTHLAFDPHQKNKTSLAHAQGGLVDLMRTHANQALQAGITTVRDLGDKDYLSLQLRDDYRQGRGPEVLAAGPPITPRQGHCWFLGGESQGTSGIRAAIAERARRGVDVVKIMATGGVITPGWGPHESQYSLAELKTAVDAAHDAGMKITAHAHGPQGIADAVAAGVDGVEHASFYTENDCVPDWNTVELLAQKQIYIGATEAWLPPETSLETADTRRLDKRTTVYARMHQEGVPVLCCSDGGVHPRKTHSCLAHGIIHFGSQLGFSNTEALAVATSRAAQACGVGDRKGLIAPGYDADIISINGDPMARLSDLLDVNAVICAGRIISNRSHA
ncbi:amidohydrolase family protein [Nocardia sp. NPDC051570]|uniref:amidohydrolase family protein n=1 Tax=Nocardia sp. NPDC051570 TaxID=3364324 RepID=UPI0037A75B55